MSARDTKDLKKFLKPFPDDVCEIALWLRSFVWNMYPAANELIYDNYNAVAFGWSLSDRLGDTFCSVAVGRSSHNVHFGFYWGSRIADPKRMLLGKGSQYRYILVRDKEDFPKTYVKRLVREAYSYSRAKMVRNNRSVKRATLTKSISPVKRSRGRGKRGG